MDSMHSSMSTVLKYTQTATCTINDRHITTGELFAIYKSGMLDESFATFNKLKNKLCKLKK